MSSSFLSLAISMRVERPNPPASRMRSRALSGMRAIARISVTAERAFHSFVELCPWL